MRLKPNQTVFTDLQVYKTECAMCNKDELFRTSLSEKHRAGIIVVALKKKKTRQENNFNQNIFIVPLFQPV